MYFVSQASDHDCGSAVVRIILANSFKKNDYLNLNLPTNPGNFLLIIKECEKNGLILVGKKSEDNAEFIKKKGLMILQLVIEDSSHFVVVRKRGNKYQVADPARGIYYIDQSELISIFNGNFLEIESKQKQEKIEKSPQIIKKTDLIPYFIVQTLSLALLISSLVTLRDTVLFYYTLAFLILGVLLVIVSKFMLVAISTKYDKKTNQTLVDVPKNKFIGLYNKRATNKKSLIGGPILLFNSLIISSLIITLLLINDWYLFICLLVITIYQIGINVYHQYLNVSHLRVDRLLKKAEKEVEERLEILDKVEKITTKHVKTLVLIDYLRSFIIISSIIFVMVLNKSSSINYLIFYFFIITHYISYFNNVLKADSLLVPNPHSSLK